MGSSFGRRSIVVSHYRTTAKAGDTGNAVFSGHVTSEVRATFSETCSGYVLGMRSHLYGNARFVYVVTVSVSSSTETSVMVHRGCHSDLNNLCGVDQSEREYTHRLIVTTKLKRWGFAPVRSDSQEGQPELHTVHCFTLWDTHLRSWSAHSSGWLTLKTKLSRPFTWTP